MSLAKEDVRKLIDVYIRAWTTQDPDLILSVFTSSATYHERVLEEPIRGHAGIREYWQTKVVNEQARIQAELLSLYLDGTTASPSGKRVSTTSSKATASGCASSPSSNSTATGSPACVSVGRPSA
jgi:SnoaL-like domain